MKKKETENGFHEAVMDNTGLNKINFFNLGKENRWEKYLNEKVSIDYKSEKLLEIQAIGVSYDRVSGLLNNFQLIKYAKLHRLKLQGDQDHSSFSISAVLSLP